MPDRDQAQHPMTDPPRRRAGDNVDPDIMLAIEHRAAENRHTLRGEMAEALISLQRDLAGIRQDVQVGNLAAVTETAQMKATLEELKRDVAHLAGLEPRVQRLEAGALADDRIGEFKRWMVGACVGVCTVVVAATGVLLTTIH